MQEFGWLVVGHAEGAPAAQKARTAASRVAMPPPPPGTPPPPPGTSQHPRPSMRSHHQVFDGHSVRCAPRCGANVPPPPPMSPTGVCGGAMQAMDGLWTEVCGQQKQSNDPGNNQHILNTPIIGRR